MMTTASTKPVDSATTHQGPKESTLSGKIEMEYISDYPTWKKALWEAYRTFGKAFVVTFAGVLIGANGIEILKDGAAISFPVFLKSLWAVVFYPGILSGIMAGIAAVGKYIRDTIGQKDYSHPVYKLPF